MTIYDNIAFGLKLYENLSKSELDGRIDRQSLHSARMTFHHPYFGVRLEFECDPPEDMKRLTAASSDLG